MDSTLACLAAWMPRQRWYAGKGRTPSLRVVATWEHAVPAGETDPARLRVRTLLIADESTLPMALYQVPTVARPTATVDIDPLHVIGNPEPGTTLIDGPHDPAYTRALLQLVLHGGAAHGDSAVARGIPSAPAGVDPQSTATVLAGEQSNTSIVYRGAEGTLPVICKVYRQLHGGLNPDIDLQGALSAAGSTRVPRTIGSVAGTWPLPEDPRRATEGSVAFAQEFLPGVEDAWRVALRAAEHGDDFRTPARELGVATADVHRTLAEMRGTTAADGTARDAVVAMWRARLSTAVAEVTALAPLREQIAAIYARASAIRWPPLQRIHGDLHLGQVILVPQRGWVLLDFEGEPLRPMAARVRPDLALRDVAGMMRSFDYVAGSIRIDHAGHAPELVAEWTGEARSAFLEGYMTASGLDLRSTAPLLAALELDKAVYEAIYEARNRPRWIVIPLSGIARLIKG